MNDDNRDRFASLQLFAAHLSPRERERMLRSLAPLVMSSMTGTCSADVPLSTSTFGDMKAKAAALWSVSAVCLEMFMAGEDEPIPDSQLVGAVRQVFVLAKKTRDYTLVKQFDSVIALRNGAYPNGVAFTARDIVWTGFYADAEVMTPAGATVRVLRDWKAALGGNSSQLFVLADGCILSANTSNDRIVKFNAALRVERYYVGLTRPRGVAGDGRFVYCADTGANRLVFFDAASGEQTLVVTSIPGATPERLGQPTGMELVRPHSDSHSEPLAGILAVADRDHHRLLVLSTAGLLLRVVGCAAGGCPSRELGRLNEPNDVAVDPDGRLLVYDTRHKRIAVFNQDGSFVCAVLEGFFRDSGNTYSSISCCQETGKVVVSDNDHHRLCFLEPYLAEND